ncbi:alanine racemase [Marichromatium bheemlicum]|uniref:Alanine racemase n=1 Tax=Marichromatium bheemlicum TaxID=365339 RepID=A0ABX1IAA0_9GAMM|nr:alanine racemase [Marichromatium bheemlicum]NKN33934.1 alanine racemase [Marichromatium bheemlicum]
MSRPARARIDLAAIRHNYLHAKSCAPSARAWAVVKADAYGHGAVAVARALAPVADGFAVAFLEEALELRESGVEGPILLLEGVFAPDELAAVDRAGLDMVVHAEHQLEWIAAARPERPFGCWLKVDSGMHRVGFAPPDVAAALARLRACPQVGRLRAISHLARADEPGEPYSARQLAAFDDAVAGVVPASLANSAAVLDLPAAHRDWVRPGIMLYGVSPFDTAHPNAAALRPAMTLESALIAIRTLPAGEPVGYGGRFVCRRPSRIGVVAIGYADGYPRHAPDGVAVMVRGQCAPLAGRVSMDMITVDLTDLPEAVVGDRVELWGTRVDAGALARASDTIAYQLFTNLKRVRVEHQA